MGKRRHSEDSHEDREEDSTSETDTSQVKKVGFSDVTIFHFPRKQGFVSVPSSGGSSLGMAKTHIYVETVSLKCSRSRKTTGSLAREAKEDPHGSTRGQFAPLPQQSRQDLLRMAGVKRILKKEEADCKDLRLSRVFCGCRCGKICYPEKCECIENGINCQSDFGRFPCSCLPNGCQNLNGRRAYNLSDVQKHYSETLARVDKR